MLQGPIYYWHPIIAMDVRLALLLSALVFLLTTCQHPAHSGANG